MSFWRQSPLLCLITQNIGAPSATGPVSSVRKIVFSISFKPADCANLRIEASEGALNMNSPEASSMISSSKSSGSWEASETRRLRFLPSRMSSRICCRNPSMRAARWNSSTQRSFGMRAEFAARRE